MPTPNISSKPISINFTDGASHPNVVTLSDGTFVVTYSTLVPTSFARFNRFEIRGRRFDEAGNPIGEEILFPFDLEIDVSKYDVVAIEQSRVAIVVDLVLTDFDNGLERLGNANVFARIFEFSENIAVVAENTVPVGTPRGTIASSPAIATVGRPDNFRVFIVERRGDQETLRMDDATLDFGPSFDLRRTLVGNRDASLACATLVGGNIAVVVDRDANTATVDDGRILVMIVTPDGTILRQGDLRTNAVRAFQPAVSALKGGGFVVGYTENDGDVDPVFRVFDAEGNGISAIRELGVEDEPGRSNNNEPAIAPLDDGGFIIIYDKDAGSPQIRGQRFDSLGNSVGKDFLVADENGAQIKATLLSDKRVAVCYAANGEIRLAIIQSQPVQSKTTVP